MICVCQGALGPVAQDGASAAAVLAACMLAIPMLTWTRMSKSACVNSMQ